MCIGKLFTYVCEAKCLCGCVHMCESIYLHERECVSESIVHAYENMYVAQIVHMCGSIVGLCICVYMHCVERILV